MIMDGLNLFDQSAAITVTRDSTNVIDLGNARDLGIGSPVLSVLVQVDTTFTAGGAATLTVALQSSADNSTYVTMAASAAIPVASLVQGARLLDMKLPRPPFGGAVPRYLKLVYTVATGPMTAGKITSALVLDRQDQIAYPPGTTVTN